MGRRGGTAAEVTEWCAFCGQQRLVAVRLPGHADIEAVVCLGRGEPQPVPVPVRETDQARGGA